MDQLRPGSNRSVVTAPPQAPSKPVQSRTLAATSPITSPLPDSVPKPAANTPSPGAGGNVPLGEARTFDGTSPKTHALPLEPATSTRKGNVRGYWKDKVALITGGSSGLGLAIARAFAEAGAVAALFARDVDRLSRAAESIKEFGRVDIFPGDVTKPEQVRSAIDQAVERYGRLDVLVNNAGRSVRRRLPDVTLDDYRQFMDVNFFSAVGSTLAALPHLQRTGGHVVNIGSLAAKTAWPFLAPYSASKFALAAYTHQLRLEGPENVHYMLVCPGPIKRDDAGVRYQDQAQNLPGSAHQPAAGARVAGIDPHRMAAKILRGCEHRKREIVYPFRARILFALLAYSPPIGDWLLKRFIRR